MSARPECFSTTPCPKETYATEPYLIPAALMIKSYLFKCGKIAWLRFSWNAMSVSPVLYCTSNFTDVSISEICSSLPEFGFNRSTEFPSLSCVQALLSGCIIYLAIRHSVGARTSIGLSITAALADSKGTATQ